MTKTARIVWLPPEQGGRQKPPQGTSYSSPAHFDGSVDDSECGQWSLVVELLSRPPGSTDWVAHVRFLVAEAPHDWLKEGAHFDLYEGRKRVAHGTVLAPVPEPANQKASLTAKANVTQ